MGLAKNFILFFFPWYHTEKYEGTFWLIQYIPILLPVYWTKKASHFDLLLENVFIARSSLDQTKGDILYYRYMSSSVERWVVDRDKILMWRGLHSLSQAL